MTSTSEPVRENGLGAATRAQAVADRLRSEIASGGLEPGTRLRQLDLAKRFGVSTTPVREALYLLQREGLVRIDAQRGATVFVPTVSDLAEIYEIRAPLEALAAARAAECIDDDNAGELEGILDAMRDSTDPEHYVALNQRFHNTLYALANRPRLSQLIGDLRDATNAYLHVYAAHDLDSDRLDTEHREILAACKAHDARRAARAVEHHLANSVQHITDQLGRTNPGTPTAAQSP